MIAAPVLKWAGGKTRLIPQYLPYLPSHFRSYWEPFVGGGALFFWLRQQREDFPAYLNDANGELVICYQVIKSQLDPLLQRLQVLQEQHCRDFYYEQRAQQPQDPIERAARLIYLNRTCYNGLYRVNSKGGFNVPMGRYRDPAIVREPQLRAAHQALQGAELSNLGFEQALKKVRKGDFVFFDPPYQPLNATSSFTAYTKDSFGLQQQSHLAELFRTLVKRGCQVLLCNSDSPEIRSLYADFAQVEIRAARMINSKSQGRRAIGELLILGKPPEP